MFVETPAEAARRHLALGRQPVPVERRGKAPTGGKGWQLRRFSDRDLPDLPAHFPPEDNIGLMLGAVSGNLVDIDLDCEEAVSFGRLYLPLTNMVHGRPSCPETHYWYVVDEPIDCEQFKAPRGAGGKMLVEFRSSRGEHGYQTVIPPSIHKDSGERLVWVDPKGSPAQVSTKDLLVSVKIVAAGSLLARSFPRQGQRHEFALALAGALLRYGTSEDDAYRFVYEVCRVGGSTDPSARAQTVSTTARKLEEGAGDVTGIPRLGEIVGEDVAKRVCEWLDLRDVSSDAIRDLAAKMMLNGVGVSPDPETKKNGTHKNGTSLFGGSVPVLPGSLPGGSGGGGSGGDDEDEIDVKRNKSGDPIAVGHNVYLMIKHSSVTKDCFRFDDVEKQLIVTGKFGEVDSSVLDVVLTDWLMSVYEINVSKNDVGDRILRIAMENKFDPIRDYLRSLSWDGVPRVDEWLKVYTKAEETIDHPDYLSCVGRKWLISAVARALDPGCKADLVLILEGEQGLRKSSLFEVLGGSWYSDLTVALGDKDAKMLNAGTWIAELPDLAALKKTSEVNAVKAFFSARVDKFRPPFGKRVITSPRRVVYGATTNDLTYLSDVTGNRRYCCVRISKVDLAAVIRDRDQLFAEAVALYDKHVSSCDDKLECACWWPTPEEAMVIEAEAQKRVEDHPATEIISAWWLGIAPKDRPKDLTTVRVAKEALRYETDKISQGVQMEVGRAMKRLGFKRIYGKIEGHVKPCWHYEASEDLRQLPQSNRFSTLVKGGMVKVAAVGNN